MSSLADFQQLSLLGEGSYSAVYKVVRHADGQVYALKKVKMLSLSRKERQNALNEVRLLASVQHKNVIAYKEAFFDDKTRCLCIVQEFANAGDLLQQIKRCRQDRAYLPETDVWRYLEGMTLGLKALHDLFVLHRDMKSANVFLSHSRNGTIAKLGDFNVSKVAKRGLCMTQTGTPYYASPEVWRDMPYDAKSDIWSLGCVLYEMVALQPPFRAEDMEGLYRKVVKGQYSKIPGRYSRELRQVIAALLQVDPQHRPTVDQLLAIPPLQCLGLAAVGAESQSHLEAAPEPNLLATILLPGNPLDISPALPGARYSHSPALSHSQSHSQAGQPGMGIGPGIRGRGTESNPSSPSPSPSPSLGHVPVHLSARHVTDQPQPLPQVPVQAQAQVRVGSSTPLERAERKLLTPSRVPVTISPAPATPQPDERRSGHQSAAEQDSLDEYLQRRQHEARRQSPVSTTPLQPLVAPAVHNPSAARPLINPRYQLPGQGHGPGQGQAQGQGQVPGRELRRPLSLFAMQQYAVVNHAQQQADLRGGLRMARQA